MRFSAALWTWLALLVLHNVEEHLTMRAFLAAHAGRLPPLAARVIGPLTPEQFDLSLLVVTVAALVLTLTAARHAGRGLAVVLVLGGQVVMGVNALQHAATAVWARGYAPGVVTGLLAMLPYGVYLVRRGVREGRATPRAIALAGAAGIVLVFPLLAGLHALAGVLVES